MIKNITLIFDDNTEVTLSGDADKIAHLIRGGDYKGFIIHENGYVPKKGYVAVDGGGWDLKALARLLNKERS